MSHVDAVTRLLGGTPKVLRLPALGPGKMELVAWVRDDGSVRGRYIWSHGTIEGALATGGWDAATHQHPMEKEVGVTYPELCALLGVQP
jgi:hypothetical protein